MTEVKNTKRALISSVIVLMLCVAMLLGTTYAWFTDSVSSMNNVIQSGNLDVELQYSTDGETWTDVTEDTAIFSEEALWEPGHTEAVALRVKNAGTLAAKYELTTSVYLEKEGTNVYGETFKLSDYLEVYACGPQDNNQVGQYLTGLVLGNRDKALGNGTAMAKTAFNKNLAQDDNLDVAEEHIICLAITMPTTVGNEANYKTGTEAPYIQFGVNLYATQAQLEKDSFGSDYDATADYAKAPKADLTYNKDNVGKDLVWNTSWGTQSKPQLETAYTFKLTESLADIENSEFAKWHADFVVTADEEIAAGDTGIAGSYGSWNWIGFSTSDTGALAKDTPVRLLNAFSSDMFVNYTELSTMVGGVFDCGVWNNEADNEGKTLTVELRLYETEKESAANGNSSNVETGRYVTVSRVKYTLK